MERACKNCDFWFATTEQETGFCRRHAPMPIYDMHGPQTIYSPKTAASFWCGDFAERQHPQEFVKKDDVLDLSIKVLKLSGRVLNACKHDYIDTIRDLMNHSEAQLLRLPNFGRKSLNEIKEALKTYDLHLVKTWEKSWLNPEKHNADTTPGHVWVAEVRRIHDVRNLVWEKADLGENLPFEKWYRLDEAVRKSVNLIYDASLSVDEMAVLAVKRMKNADTAPGHV